MGDNIFTGNIFIEILVRFEGNSSPFTTSALLSGFIEKSNQNRAKHEVESSIYFVNVQS